MIPQAAIFPGGLVFQTNFPGIGGFPLTGNPATADGISVSCSGAGTGNEAPSRVVNGGGLEWQSGGVGVWWRIEFEGLRRVTNLGIAATSPAQPTTFSFQASNDAASWTNLLTGLSSGGLSSNPVTAQPYRFYRMISTAVTDITRLGNLTFTFSAI